MCAALRAGEREFKDTRAANSPATGRPAEGQAEGDDAKDESKVQFVAEVAEMQIPARGAPHEEAAPAAA